MSDTAVATADTKAASSNGATAKDAVALSDVLHDLVARAQFGQDVEQKHHNAIRTFFQDVLNGLSDEEKAGRMAPVDLAAPGAPAMLMHGFTQEQFNAAVAAQVKASIGAEVQKALAEFMAAQKASGVATGAPAPPVSAPSAQAETAAPQAGT
jgi:hypothetical protein